MRVRALAAAALMACLLAATAGGQEPEDEPLVRVNGYLITRTQVDHWLRALEATGQRPAMEAAMSVLERQELDAQRRKDALEALIERRVLSDLARQRYLNSDSAQQVTDRIAEEEMRQFEERTGSKLKAAQLLSEAGLTTEQFKEVQLQNVLIGQLLYDEVYSRLSVTPAEVRLYYEEHMEEFKVPRTVIYRQVLLPAGDRSDEAAQREAAEAALKEIRAGTDFARVADKFSADKDRYPGGLHTVQVPDELPDWLPPAVQGLEAGQVSEVRRVAAGFSIVKLDEVRASRAASFEEVQGRIKTKLLESKRLEAHVQYVTQAKGQARIEYYQAAADLGLP